MKIIKTVLWAIFAFFCPHAALHEIGEDVHYETQKLIRNFNYWG